MGGSAVKGFGSNSVGRSEREDEFVSVFFCLPDSQREPRCACQLDPTATRWARRGVGKPSPAPQLFE